MSNKNMNMIIEGLNDNKDIDKIKKIILKTLDDYVNEFYTKVTNKNLPEGHGIDARYYTDTSYSYGHSGKAGTFTMDYSCIYKTYSKEEAKLALNIFRKYANIIEIQLNILKFQYKDIEIYAGKSGVSGAKIGKGLSVYNLPFDLPHKMVVNTKEIWNE